MKNEVLRFDKAALSYGKQKAVAQLSLTLCEGETLAIVGESGCGKTTLLKAILGLEEYGVRISEGEVTLFGNQLKEAAGAWRRRLLGKELCLISQNPDSAFNPIRSYQKQFKELLKSHGCFEGKASYERMKACFESLSLENGDQILTSCPYEMSGGMKQRIAIAFSLLRQPRLLLLDEPTSALDVTTQKTVLEELIKLRRLSGTTMLLITHDLGVAARMADRIGVMYAGRLVEIGSANQVLKHPAHPYTRALLRAIPGTKGIPPEGLEGVPPLYGAELAGCGFAERCSLCQERCKEKAYEMTEVETGHYSACQEGAYGE